jgi:hypothetical protein
MAGNLARFYRERQERHPILDFGFWILDFGFWILDFGFWILDFGFWIRRGERCAFMHARVRAIPAKNHPVSRNGCLPSFIRRGALRSLPGDCSNAFSLRVAAQDLDRIIFLQLPRFLDGEIKPAQPAFEKSLNNIHSSKPDSEFKAGKSGLCD